MTDSENLDISNKLIRFPHFYNIDHYPVFITDYTVTRDAYSMKTLARTTLVVLLILAGLPSLLFAAGNPDPIETVVPYEFPAGLVNVIQHSENPSTPFWNWVEEKYPLFKANYTVQNDGWLEIYTYQFNGTKPVLLLNGDETYATRNPFYSEKVYSGDFVELVLFPQENLNSSFSIEVDNMALTIYEVYDWDDLIGEIVFTETPRPEINTSILWSKEEPFEGDSLIFSASGVKQGDSWVWTLDGPDLHLVNTDCHFITPELDDGDYSITLFVEDEFGYTKSVTRSFTVEPNLESLLYDPALTSLELLDVSYPELVEPNTLISIWVSVRYSTPVSRDIQVCIVDTESGDTLSIVEDQVIGEGVESYSVAIPCADINMQLDANIQYLHEETWINEGLSKMTISVAAPIVDKSIPGYPVLGLALGLLVFVLKRKY